MWLDYNRRILADTRPEERIITHYDSYFLNSGNELRRLIQWTGLSPDDAAMKSASEAISASTRQQQSFGEDDKAVVPAEVGSLYRELCQMAGDDLKQALNGGTLSHPQAAEPGPALPGQPVVSALREQARKVFDEAQEKIAEEDTVAALALLVEAVTLDPHLGPGHNDLGVLLMQAGEPRLALDYLKLAASLNPSDNSTTTNLVTVYIALGRNEDAIKSYLALLENSPDDIQALYWLASIAGEVNNPAKARECAERLLALQPDHTGAQKVLTALDQRE
jgi:tetratricopeptide (TPR) repeat protein